MKPPARPPSQGRLTAPDHAGPARGADHVPGAAAGGKPYARPGTHAAGHQRGGRPQGPAGTVWIYGIHPVAAALKNPARRLRRLVLTAEAEATLAQHVPQPFSVAGERAERGRLDHLLGPDAVHQGAALLADPLPQPPLTHILERPGPLLVLDQVTDPRNVGAILRSAAAFGVAGVITQDRNAPEETGALAKAASGALETVPLIRAVNLARTLVALKAANVWCVGLAANAPALRGTAFADRRVALVLGAEGTGMRRLTRDTCDELAGLATPGDMESLNVSVAAAVSLYELTRR
jgi:23S rRNA (guanosine2251-2'-O)-methyltransferase